MPRRGCRGDNSAVTATRCLPPPRPLWRYGICGASRRRSPVLPAFPRFNEPELQTINNDIELIKITQNQDTAKKQPLALFSLRLQTFTFQNEPFWGYLSSLPVKLLCTLPDGSERIFEPQMENQKYQFGGAAFEVSGSPDQDVISFKFLDSKDDRPLAEAQLPLRAIQEEPLTVRFHSNVPVDRFRAAE